MCSRSTASTTLWATFVLKRIVQEFAFSRFWRRKSRWPLRYSQEPSERISYSIRKFAFWELLNEFTGSRHCKKNLNLSQRQDCDQKQRKEASSVSVIKERKGETEEEKKERVITRSQTTLDNVRAFEKREHHQRPRVARQIRRQLHFFHGRRHRLRRHARECENTVRIHRRIRAREYRRVGREN